MMRRRFCRGVRVRGKGERGQALVEFLFCIGLFVMIISVGILMVLVSVAKTKVNVAAYYACRAFVTTYSESEAKSAARKVLYYPPLLSVECPSDPGFGRKATVKVEMKYRLPDVPVIRRMFAREYPQGGGMLVPLRAKCTMTME